MRYLSFSVLLLMILCRCNAQDTIGVRAFTIGDSTIYLETKYFKGGDTGIIYLNIHDNENTATEAAEQFLPLHGGTLFQLKHSGSRLIGFNVNEQVFTFDPNRIYSDTGRKATIKPASASSKEAISLVEQFADEILATHFNGKKLVVALHNNSEGNLSIYSYQKGGSEGEAALLVYHNPEMDPDDFILTTEKFIFDGFQERKINAVLQTTDPPDDGSMSVYAQLNGVPYINIEAQADHIEEQVYMLGILQSILNSTKNDRK